MKRGRLSAEEKEYILKSDKSSEFLAKKLDRTVAVVEKVRGTVEKVAGVEETVGTKDGTTHRPFNENLVAQVKQGPNSFSMNYTMSALTDTLSRETKHDPSVVFKPKGDNPT